jgi:hypothetical protein
LVLLQLLPVHVGKERMQAAAAVGTSTVTWQRCWLGQLSPGSVMCVGQPLLMTRWKYGAGEATATNNILRSNHSACDATCKAMYTLHITRDSACLQQATDPRL